MAQYEVSWIQTSEIRPEDLDKVCSQVYVWIFTKDKCVVIVSKDGQQWQLPGGKPEPGETLHETAIREVREETSLDISKMSDNLQFLGYRIVNNVESEEPPYLQVRYLLRLNAETAILELGAQNEDGRQSERDIVRFVSAVSLRELVERIPWLADSPEFTNIDDYV